MKHFLIKKKKKGAGSCLAAHSVREDTRHIITSTQTKTGALEGAGIFMEEHQMLRLWKEPLVS